MTSGKPYHESDWEDGDVVGPVTMNDHADDHDDDLFRIEQDGVDVSGVGSSKPLNFEGVVVTDVGTYVGVDLGGFADVAADETVTGGWTFGNDVQIDQNHLLDVGRLYLQDGSHIDDWQVRPFGDGELIFWDGSNTVLQLDRTPEEMATIRGDLEVREGAEIQGNLTVDGDANLKDVGNGYVYAGGYPGASNDARLDAALADIGGADGYVVHLERGVYSSNRTISTRIGFVGTEVGLRDSGPTRITGEWTFNDRAWMTRCEFRNTITFNEQGNVFHNTFRHDGTVLFDTPSGGRAIAIGNSGDGDGEIIFNSSWEGAAGHAFAIGNDPSITDNTPGGLVTIIDEDWQCVGGITAGGDAVPTTDASGLRVEIDEQDGIVNFVTD